MPVIATWSPLDAALDAVVPLGLAVAARTCLVIDLDPDGPAMGTGPSLADLVRDGAERRHLEPQGRGPAFLSNGGVEAADAVDVVAAVVDRWPAVVLRCPAKDARPDGAVALLPLLPEPFLRVASPPAAYQRCGFSPTATPPGLVLPRPRRRTLEALLGGRRPPRVDPWIRAVGRLWGPHA